MLYNKKKSCNDGKNPTKKNVRTFRTLYVVDLFPQFFGLPDQEKICTLIQDQEIAITYIQLKKSYFVQRLFVVQ